MKTIKIDDETIDALIRDVLSSDYLSLIDNVRAIDAKIESGTELLPYELEDLANWVKTVSAINVLFDWYLTSDDAEKIRNQGQY